MSFIKGKIRNEIYQSTNGFFVGTFRVKDTDDEALLDSIGKTITITGLLLEPNMEETYILKGEYIKHDRFGFQYQFREYDKVDPEGKEAIIEYLSSSLIKGCGIKTAEAIVETLGEDAIAKIKENKNSLLLVPLMTEKKATKIYESIIEHSSNDDTILLLKQMGFTIEEATKIVSHYKGKARILIDTDLYSFCDLIPFSKLDFIFLKNHEETDKVRICHCIIESLNTLSNTQGDTYSYKEEVLSLLQTKFKLFLEEEEFENYLEDLVLRGQIVLLNNRIYLSDMYNKEKKIASHLMDISKLPSKRVGNLEEKLKFLEEFLKVNYSKEQKEAIFTALKERITIISGGPGTGKTTIINAIVKLYIDEYQLSPLNTLSTIALLAPTGRAAKKMSESTHMPASTIHRYLKWNKETNDFGINETNKTQHKLIIVDEVSMIDTDLFDALLKGLETNVQLILVGDTFQLPSVGAGLILQDLVSSDLFSFCPLNHIFRQSENSYIPYLAKEIKEKSIASSFTDQKDDYNFLEIPSIAIKNTIIKICEKCIQKGMPLTDIQILAPMYKGENGIDRLNESLQNLFNPSSEEKKEITFGEVIYREGDKVLQLVNNPDANVFNGDIGYIISIETKNTPKKGEYITIDFDGNEVIYKKEDLFSIRHAYAMTIHKSQGSEFPHVIMPISKSYYKMLYNKLIYTGISRAKKSLILVGEKNAFLMAVNNDYSAQRKTSLKESLMHNLS